MERQDTALPPALAAFADRLSASDETQPAGDVMVVVAHPDDETIGIGGQFRSLQSAMIVHVTDGAPRDGRDARAHGFATCADYAAARRRELAAALSEVGIGAELLAELGVPDQGAALSLPALSRSLATLIAERAPRFVCTHPYEGGHPDHDAVAFAIHAACRLLSESGRPPPDIIEMAFYHAAPGGTVFQRFPESPSAACLEIHLDEAASRLKRRMLAHHVTQQRTLAPFGVFVERYRLAPAYDFTEPPNGGLLHYAALPLGLAGAEWPKLVRQAMEELGWATWN
jgi:LmbE family N-acetylglucosaminyl deacetylase